MLMFSRLLTLSGSPRRAMPWAVGITEYVNAHSSLSVSCWLGGFGYPLGTVAWSSLVDSQAALAAGTADLLTDPAYFDMIESAADMVAGPGQDSLRELVYGTPGEPPALGAVTNVTTATAIVDRMADAVGWAVEIAQHVESVINTPVAVLTDVFGTLGTITWISSQPDFAAADTARGKISADGDYLKRVSGSKGLFIEGSGHVGQVTRIA
ncbi:MAG: hypothetical protein JJD93_17780 [Ilumatobacteraceae bacterium]|nr:hypothetical protein [Ilumatobacteraceae bacterium]